MTIVKDTPAVRGPDELLAVQAALEQKLREIAVGNTAALESLFEFVSGRLFGIQLRILKNRELAEDALQETFFKVWKNASAYDARHGTPMTWLNTLARNHALDVLRRSSTRADVSVKVADLNLDTWRDPERAYAETFEDVESLNFCLDKLSADTQACIVGVYCDGYTQEEMSETLQRPIGTVKSWVRRGLTSLRECLENEH